MGLLGSPPYSNRDISFLRPGMGQAEIEYLVLDQFKGYKNDLRHNFFKCRIQAKGPVFLS